MRELKFRAWDKIRKYYYLYLTDIHFDGSPHAATFISSHGDNETREIDELEIEQFTGLHDNNGKEIYEGDILEVRNLHDGHDQYWNQPTGPAIPFEVKWYDRGWEIPFDTCNFEIVGNIHENAELLEDK